jgi:sialic acid synthase SpsE
MFKILVCGRGYSSKYYEPFKKGYGLLCGYNQPQNFDTFDLHFYSKSKEEGYSISNNLITESSICIEYGIESLKVGSTTFGLYPLFFFLQKKYGICQIDLVGFDFRYIYEQETSLSDLDIQAYINIESQKIFSSKLKKMFPDLIINIIGFDDFSDIDPKTGEIINKSDTNVEIVAEITTNHFGDTNRLIELITAAKSAGADSIKLQMRDVHTFYSKEKLESEYISPFGKTFFDYRVKLELTDEQLLIVDQLCTQLNIKYFFSVLDRKSYDRLIKYKPYRIKLPSTISNRKDYLDFVFQNFDGEIVVSTGMTDQSFIDYIRLISKKSKKLFLLHCISSYPVNIFNLNLKIITNYTELAPNIIAGYSSHDIGYLGSMFAVFSGAKMIEKHVKLGNSDFAHFDETALDIYLEFPEFIEKIRASELILGRGKKGILSCEDHKY